MSSQERVLAKWPDAEISSAFAVQPDKSRRWMYCVMSSLKWRVSRGKRRVVNVGAWKFSEAEAWDSAFESDRAEKEKSMKTFVPLYDRILIRRIDGEDSSRNGIIIPDTTKEKPQEGEVIGVGCGRIDHGRLTPLLLKPGARVLFGKYAGTEIKLDGEEYLIIREEEVLGALLP